MSADSICMRVGDRRPVLRVQLAVQGDPSASPLADYAEVRLKMRNRTSGELKVDAAAVAESIETRTVSYTWAVGDTDTPGEYEAWFAVAYGDGTVQSFPSCEAAFRINIEA